MSGRPDSNPDPGDVSRERKPAKFGDISIVERWAPLVRDPENTQPTPPKTGYRLLAAALSLIVLAGLLWALT